MVRPDRRGLSFQGDAMSPMPPADEIFLAFLTAVAEVEKHEL